MNPVVVIIDQGVDKNHSKLKNVNISGVTIKAIENRFEVFDQQFEDETGHGTAIAGIIFSYVPDTQIFALKLLSDNGIISERLLVEGLKYCFTIKGVKVINVSMGIATQNASDELIEICRLLYLSGITVVAASYYLTDMQCFPANLETVISVGSAIMAKKGMFRLIKNGYTNILSKGTAQRVLWKNNTYKVTSGTSYAAAHFSGIISNFFEQNKGDKQLPISAFIESHSDDSLLPLSYIEDNANFQKRSALTDTDYQSHDKLFKLDSRFNNKNLAVFPASEKEMETVVKYAKMAGSQVAIRLDYPKKITQLINGSEQELPSTVLRRALTGSEFNQFDWIALGYFLDSPVEWNVLFGINLVRDCIMQNKNIITLDAKVYKLCNKIKTESQINYTGEIYLPKVDNNMKTALDSYANLPKVDRPVLTFVGTGSKQGKITAQLALQKYLRDYGYTCSHISTEPQGILLGSSFVFPYGYKGTVDLKLSEWNRYVQMIMKAVNHFNSRDIIITGIQGGILPRAASHNEQENGSILTSLHYLIATKPDGVICAINSTDTIEHIKNTRDTVFNFAKASVIFYVMSPYYLDVSSAANGPTIRKKLNNEEFNKKMSYFSSALEKPVLDVLDSNNSGIIINLIQKHFSPESVVA